MSKITVIKKTEEVRHIFTCRHCGSHEYNMLSARGRVAGMFEKRYLCLKCRKVNESED